MSAELQVKTDKDTFNRAKSWLDGIPGGLKRAGIRSSNRATASGKTLAKRILAKAVDVKIKAMAHAILIHKATSSHASSVLRVKSRGLNLIEFGAHGAVGIYGNYSYGGIYADVMGKSIHLPHAFGSPGVDSHKMLIFHRIGIKRRMKKGRYAGTRTLKEVIAGVPGMTAQEIVALAPGGIPSVRDKVAEEMNKNMNHEIQRVIQQREATGDE
jgi:hypothetical protein